jgi:nicotinamidase-related amidase
MTSIIHGRAAILISECQRGVIEPGMGSFTALIDQVTERRIVPRIADLVARFRAAELPVIHMPAAHRPDFADVLPNTLINALARKHRQMVAGTEQTDFVAELRPEPQDFVIPRTSGMIPFHGTTLEITLRRLGISTVVLTGVSTNLAIAGAAIAASEMGYHVLIPEDCIAGSDANTHNVIVNEQLRMIARITTAADVAAAIA